MARCLMWYCKNRNKAGCDEAIRAVRNTYPEPDGLIYHIIRHGDEQEDLDRKCEFCPQGLFEMENLKCPVCHADCRFERANPDKVNLGSESAPEWFYLFRCESGHNLCNKKDILG